MGFENDASTYSELSLHECGRQTSLPKTNNRFAPSQFHMLHYVLHGKGVLTLSGVSHQMKQGDCFYVPPGTVPSLSSGSSDPWAYEWVGFGGTRSSEIVSRLGLSAETPVIHDGSMTLKSHFDAIVNEYLASGGLNLYCLGEFTSLLGRILRKNGAEERGGDDKAAHIFAAKEYIRHNFQNQITIEDIAKNVGVSPNYLSSLFNKFEGMSTKFYLTKIRMETASSLLKSGTCLVKDAGAMVGYPNQLHFSSEFRKYFGICPRAYIESERSKEAKQKD